MVDDEGRVALNKYGKVYLRQVASQEDEVLCMTHFFGQLMLPW